MSYEKQQTCHDQFESKTKFHVDQIASLKWWLNVSLTSVIVQPLQLSFPVQPLQLSFPGRFYRRQKTVAVPVRAFSVLMHHWRW
jgi:hypothetical protein